MGARVDFLVPEEPHNAQAAASAQSAPRLRVPASAVRIVAGKNVVWLVQNGRLASRTIEAGPESGGFREVRSGLAGGEQLLMSGVADPAEGLRVKTGP
jgi:hypothetical protein